MMHISRLALAIPFFMILVGCGNITNSEKNNPWLDVNLTEVMQDTAMMLTLVRHNTDLLQVFESYVDSTEIHREMCPENGSIVYDVNATVATITFEDCKSVITGEKGENIHVTQNGEMQIELIDTAYDDSSTYTLFRTDFPVDFIVTNTDQNQTVDLVIHADSYIDANLSESNSSSYGSSISYLYISASVGASQANFDGVGLCYGDSVDDADSGITDIQPVSVESTGPIVIDDGTKVYPTWWSDDYEFYQPIHQRTRAVGPPELYVDTDGNLVGGAIMLRYDSMTNVDEIDLQLNVTSINTFSAKDMNTSSYLPLYLWR